MHRDIKDVFLDKLIAAARSYTPGNPLDPGAAALKDSQASAAAGCRNAAAAFPMNPGPDVARISSTPRVRRRHVYQVSGHP
ncbi:hypothetical protein [Paraburkholderia sp.]|jgi:hypothetical protein|uniref:hypothetical protein n=1 Tax=Paraburkholderia sp. TaxID=1926495 RepID=UPI002AFFD00B|nr:hypothetical protein [Paraburkholderia sp.]